MFKWTEDYLIGIEEIDQQHKNLFDIASTLKEKIAYEIDGNEKKEIIVLAIELVEFVKAHFKTEERYIKNINCQIQICLIWGKKL